MARNCLEGPSHRRPPRSYAPQVLHDDDPVKDVLERVNQRLTNIETIIITTPQGDQQSGAGHGSEATWSGISAVPGSASQKCPGPVFNIALTRKQRKQASAPGFREIKIRVNDCELSESYRRKPKPSEFIVNMCLGTRLWGQGKVKIPVHGVVVSDIPIHRMNTKNQLGAIEAIKQSNEKLLGNADIHQVHWLGKAQPGKSWNALVIEFHSIYVADTVVKAQNIAFEGAPKRSKGSTKTASHSKEHTNKQCPDIDNRAKWQCGACKRHRHRAWDPECERKKTEIARIMAAKKALKDDPYFLPDVTITPGISATTTRAPSTVGSDHQGGAELTPPSVNSSPPTLPLPS
ncbi:uncharacterized protein LY89DRAFT_740937 [Mollisia scopiformis]|uniref:Uncharacterized protein n=1 Tax=Mollisia scopiformis TaxID=149040 RepID=A0A132BAC3_MOLSC|nr:uncharacterized protein LY89DRAFT_740937 [Mollisia scopiformis]KUJ09203.1 hypothetical protein LY89DRAFT_740937 [Mollisia scopiformis]